MAMVNVDVSPSVILGVGLIGAGVSLWQIRQAKPWISKDYDVVVSCISLLVGGILIFQGWRLDPLLLFGQLMTTGAAVSFAIEALRLRSEVYEQEEKAALQDVFRRKGRGGGREGGSSRGDGGFQLPPPPPGFNPQDADEYYTNDMNNTPMNTTWGSRGIRNDNDDGGYYSDAASPQAVGGGYYYDEYYSSNGGGTTDTNNNGGSNANDGIVNAYTEQAEFYEADEYYVEDPNAVSEFEFPARDDTFDDSFKGDSGRGPSSLRDSYGTGEEDWD